MKLLLFRHAERENIGQGNPRLTARGQKQASLLANLINQGKLPKATRMMVSPRIRTHMTFEPAARELSLNLQERIELDERQSSEQASQFHSRVENFLNACAREPGVTYLCTHLDWIEEALILIPSDSDLLKPQYQTWAPGQHMVFEIIDGLWKLEEFRSL